jgi:hypothetical protein
VPDNNPPVAVILSDFNNASDSATVAFSAEPSYDPDVTDVLTYHGMQAMVNKWSVLNLC